MSFQSQRIDLIHHRNFSERKSKIEKKPTILLRSKMALGKTQESIEVGLSKAPSTIGSYKIKDHFSLNAPSSTVNFKDVECHIFSDGTEQLILEKQSDTITAKKVSEATPGLFFIRLFYSIVSSFMAGFLFIFSIQVVLFLFLGVLQASGNGGRVFQFGKNHTI